MSESNVRVIGRYALYNPIAAGGMATVHLGRLLGPVGFSRTVAIKRLHAQFASDPEFVSMFLDEARLAARIRHPNVVPTLDVVATGGELFLVMDYVAGESLARLTRAVQKSRLSIPLRILSNVMAGVLHGLHSAHEAKDERGHPLGIVHRDVSPQNVLVGIDGVARVLDFGVAKAAGRVQTTKEGQIKGKLSYMPPEQLRGAAVSRQTDIYAVGVMLWEAITGQRLFSGDNEGVIVTRVLEGRIERPSNVLLRTRRSTFTDQIMRQLEALDEVVLRALRMHPDERYPTARDMALEIERRSPPATASEVADWVEHIARDVLSSRAAMVAEIESSASVASDKEHVQAVLNAKSTLSGPVLRPPSAPPTPSQPIFMGPPTPRASFHEPMAAPIPPVTQPSSISVSTGTFGNWRPPSRAPFIAGAVGLLLGVAVLGVVFVGAKRWERSVVTSTTGDLPSTTTSAAEPAPPPPPPPPPSAEPLANAEVVLDAGPPPSAKSTSGVATKKTPKPPASTTTADDCNPPYWFDASGVKKYKAHCLGR